MLYLYLQKMIPKYTCKSNFFSRIHVFYFFCYNCFIRIIVFRKYLCNNTYSQWLLFVDIILLPFLCTYYTAKTIETFQICRIIGLKEKLWFATLLQQEFQAKATSSLHTTTLWLEHWSKKKYLKKLHQKKSVLLYLLFLYTTLVVFLYILIFLKGQNRRFSKVYFFGPKKLFH